jgi:carbamoyltransferase
MNVLGITDGITCGAAVVRDGVVLSAVNEERLSRLKMAFGFPRASIAEVLQLAGLAPSEIDLVTVATENNYLFDGVRAFDGWFSEDKGLLRNAVFSVAGKLGFLIDTVPGMSFLYYKSRWPVYVRRRRRIQQILAGEFGVTAPVEFVDHHLAHAASAYFTSGFEDALVVTMDGGGDGSCGHVYEVRNGHFERIACTPAYHSLGNYYAYVTHICGFKAQKHEGKITGLAAHGQPVYQDLLNNMITVVDGQFRNTGKVVFMGAIQALRERLPDGWTREDLSASIQKQSEDLASRYVQQYLDPTRPRDVAIAGGLFANVRINQEVYELEGVRRLFVHPGMTDAGLAVGSALIPCIQNRTGPTMPWNPDVIRDVYYGPAFSDGEIEKALDDAELSYSRPASIASEVGRLLAEGYVVARFDGRMEYGPRALGNRSILYQPADRSVNDWLNHNLRRTEFMPFAPSTLVEYAGHAYENCNGALDSARFMTITFDCTEELKRTCPGVVHIDGTARPQLVRQEDNPGYWEIIDEFRKLTGVPTIINTSFNMHEEPIVCSPGDAIRAFQQGHLDYLAIGDYLVASPVPSQRKRVPMSILNRT